MPSNPADLTFSDLRPKPPAAPMDMVLELNFLPERYRRRFPSLKRIRPAMFALCFMLLLVPLTRTFADSRQSLALAEASLLAVQAELRAYQPLAEQRAALAARLEAARSAILEIEAAYRSADIRSVTWNLVLGRSLEVVPEGVQITQITQSGEEIIFSGTAASHSLPARLADNLRGLNDFSQVSIQSVSRLEPPEPEGEVEAAEEASEALPALGLTVPRYQFEISAQLIQSFEAAQGVPGE